MPDLPRVAVILVNHGEYARRFLADCHAGLAAQDYPRDRFELFIVDNESTPESRRLIGEIAPGARLLPQRENLGWAGGNNAGVRAALTEAFDLIVTLNMDTVVEPSWLRELVEKALANPHLQILQSKIRIFGTDRINSVGNRIQFLGYGHCNGYGQRDGLDLPAHPMDYASGAAMLIRWEVFERIGLFREEYFMYCDDMEFCWRARLAGFNVGLAERSVCQHKYDWNRVRGSIFLLERNRWLTLLGLAERRTLACILPCLLAAQGALAGYLTLTGRAPTLLRLVRTFCRKETWRRVAEHRRLAARLRRRPDAEIVGRFAGPILFAEIDSPMFRLLVNPLLRGYWALARRLIAG